MKFTLHHLVYQSPKEQYFDDLDVAAWCAWYFVEENTAYPVKITEGETIHWQNEDDGGESIDTFLRKRNAFGLAPL